MNATRSIRSGLYLGLATLFVLHQDLWLWHDGRLLLGLPVGLTYHVLFCLGVSLWMLLLVRFAWPFFGDVPAGDEPAEDEPA